MAELSPDELHPAQFYAKKLIGDLQPADGLVQLTGYARNKNANDDFYLDDTTGQIQAQNIPEESPQITEGNLYRVFGKYEIDGTGTPIITAHIVQNMQNLEFDLFLKTMKKWKELP